MNLPPLGQTAATISHTHAAKCLFVCSLGERCTHARTHLLPCLVLRQHYSPVVQGPRRGLRRVRGRSRAGSLSMPFDTDNNHAPRREMRIQPRRTDSQMARPKQLHGRRFKQSYLNGQSHSSTHRIECSRRGDELFPDDSPARSAAHPPVQSTRRQVDKITSRLLSTKDDDDDGDDADVRRLWGLSAPTQQQAKASTHHVTVQKLHPLSKPLCDCFRFRSTSVPIVSTQMIKQNKSNRRSTS